MGKDEDYEQAKKYLDKYFKENSGTKGFAGNIDLDEMVKQYAATKMMSSFGAKQDTDFDKLVSAIERTRGTGMDPQMMMMMFMMMGQNSHSTTPPYPYQPYPQQSQSTDDDFMKMLRMKIFADMFNGKGNSGLDDFMKLYTIMNPGKGSDMDKFIAFMKDKEMQDKDDRTQRSIDAMKDELRRNFDAYRNPPQGTDPLTIVRNFQTLKQSLDEVYRAMTPEQQAELPRSGEDWTADDVVTLAQKIIGTVPTIATAVGAVRGDRRPKPPKKEIVDENRPLPTDHVRGELPEDIEQYFKTWRGPPGTAMTDPNGTRFENPDTPGTYYTKGDMIEYAKKDPEGMRQLIGASQRRKQAEDVQAREQSRREQRVEEQRNRAAIPPAPPSVQEPQQQDEWKENPNDNADAEQSTQTEQEPPVDPDAVETPENYSEPPEGEGNGSEEK